ncbi:MAG: PD40 domain-containing protein [Acidobacteria bacterium]|nr:PD40 domain-containing protein [Acidobacteriota bacterium]
MSEPSRVRFGVFEVDLHTREVWKQGLLLRLQDQPFCVLQALLEHPGELVTREELQHKIWAGDTFVDFEQSLNRAVNKLRDALGDDAGTPRFIETLPRRGYRFIAPVDGPGKPAPPLVSDGKPSRKSVWGAAGALLIVGAGLWWLRGRQPPPPPRVVTLTTLPGIESTPAFSPDGRQVAFAWNGERQENFDVYVKVVGDTSVLRLTSDPGYDGLPAWSLDGRQIAFLSARSGGGIYVVSPIGGPERKVADFGASFDFCWTADGKGLLVVKPYPPVSGEPAGGALFLVPVEGGEAPRSILTPPPGTRYANVVLSPDGRSVAFGSCQGGGSGATCRVQVAEFQNNAIVGRPRQISTVSMRILGLAWTADGSSLVYGQGERGLWRVPIHGGTNPERVELAGGAAVYPAIDRKGGRLAYSQVTTQADIWRLERGGKPTPFLASTLRDAAPQYSPDGSRIAFESERGGNGLTVWAANADGSGAVQLAKPRSGTPRWSPDGRWVAFDAFGPNGHWDVWVVDASGGAPRQLTHGPGDNPIPSWSRDGKWIYFTSNRTGRFEVWRIPAGGGDAQQITRNGGYTTFESTDGVTIYYTLTEPGDGGLYAKRLPDGEERQIINESVVARGFAVFSDGIYYIHGLGQSRTEIRFHAFAGGRSQIISELEGPLSFGLTLSPDRKTFLFSKYVNVGQDLMMIENFR